MRRLFVHSLVLTAVMGLAAVMGTAAAPASAAPAVPYIRGTSTVPVYLYADAIRESVWVQTPLDNDYDGVPDKVAVDVVRPRAGNVRVPVIMQASPFYGCCGRGNEKERKEYDAAGTISKQPLFYDNYFVPRGYAVIAVDMAGTGRSTGCTDTDGREDTLGTKAAIDWLNGRAKATYADGSPAVATGWTNGRVGMIGKSADGTVTNEVAATGVEGLKTVVPIAATSSGYDYARHNGVVVSPDANESLFHMVTSRPAEACARTLAELDAGSDDATGDYNAFWAERDLRPHASKVRASVFLVHGLNDGSVMTDHFAQWWKGLKVPRKMWLSQAGNVDPFDFRRAEWVDTLHRWFDFYLQGLHNGIDREPQVSMETSPGKWTDQPAWPAPGAHQVQVQLGNGDGTTGTLGGRSGTGERTWVDNPDLFEDAATANPNGAVAGRAAFLSGPLTRDLRISGTPAVTLRVQVDRPTTELTARLVDYGTIQRVNTIYPNEGIRTLDTESCWGASTAADDACYRDTAQDVVTSDRGILTRGWQDAAHRVSLRFRVPLQAGRWYSITVPMQATDQTVRARHVLGVILQQSDLEYSTPSTTGATVRMDLRGSHLTLPVVGSAGLPQPGKAAPRVKAAAAATSHKGTHRRNSSIP
ncbi:Xaa-Pro dipeptidyl-peptidase [Streptomyces sp. H10-C2]|uniref:Xaa-Pro dipeptidyl-peptidase n=1 Tax=unclassified Streptomyces TaxID=2593676 RepID=UPI0024BA117E|nr:MULTISPECIES: Xaa-Pro dipeptidyl-peptidase [unclassified Streptomyces]MDJ0344778.1 Xaa-Pro dipeptidyl-peptidase [Streptomyces sp. PH10-H1]MDJ0369663.1 Xaa-Pro dipeptidyl-peptidase [Streptomyces sp. H10-C2]